MSKSKRSKNKKRSKVVIKVNPKSKVIKNINKEKGVKNVKTKITEMTIAEKCNALEWQLGYIIVEPLNKSGIEMITEQCKAVGVNRKIFDKWLEGSKYNASEIWDGITAPKINEEQIGHILLLAAMALANEESFMKLGRSNMSPFVGLTNIPAELNEIPEELMEEALCSIEDAEERLLICDYSVEEMIESGELSTFEFNGETMLSNAQIHSTIMYNCEKMMGEFLLEIMPVPVPSECGLSYYDLVEWLKAADVTLEQVIEWSGRYYHPDSVRKLWDYIISPRKNLDVFDNITEYIENRI